MNHSLNLFMSILLALLLAACVAPQNNNFMDSDLTQEPWRAAVHTQPQQWATHADKWFHTGSPNATELKLQKAPVAAAVSMMNVKVSDFKKISVDGDFQVQIIGTNEANAVKLYGTNAAIQHISVELEGDTLCLTQTSEYPAIDEAIIRVEVNQLNELTQEGAGTIEGVGIRSNGLSVESAGSGDVYLAGRINLQQVINESNGAVNVFDTKSPWLEIESTGAGPVNVSGKVGVKSILASGSGDVNIIGAYGNGLVIDAQGTGKVGVNGVIGIQAIHAGNHAKVYAYTVQGKELKIDAAGSACLGLAGNVEKLILTAAGNSRFFGRSLCTEAAYVLARDYAHVNFSATTKALASAADYSSVYFFGDPASLTTFLKGSGTIIPLLTDLSCCGMPEVQTATRSLKGE